MIFGHWAKKLFFTEIENGNLQGGLGSGWPSSGGIWEVHEASVLWLWKDPPNVLFSHGVEWVYAQSLSRIRSCFVTLFWKSFRNNRYFGLLFAVQSNVTWGVILSPIFGLFSSLVAIIAQLVKAAVSVLYVWPTQSWESWGSWGLAFEPFPICSTTHAKKLHVAEQVNIWKGETEVRI